MHPDTEQPFTLAQMATPRRRRTGLIVCIAAGVAVLAVVTVALLVMRGSADSGKPAADPTPVSNGITRPDPSCVTTDGTDHKDYWDGNGWWAGRVDGTEKEMPSLTVLSLKLAGHQISSAWICAPRANG